MRKFLLHATLVALPVLGYGQIFQENFDGNGQGIAAWTTRLKMRHLLRVVVDDDVDRLQV